MTETTIYPDEICMDILIDILPPKLAELVELVVYSAALTSMAPENFCRGARALQYERHQVRSQITMLLAEMGEDHRLSTICCGSQN